MNFRLQRSLHQNLLIDDHVHSLRRINAAPSKLSVASIPVKPGIDESSSDTVSLDLVESRGKASSASRTLSPSSSVSALSPVPSLSVSTDSEESSGKASWGSSIQSLSESVSITE